MGGFCGRVPAHRRRADVDVLGAFNAAWRALAGPLRGAWSGGLALP
jgi:hypothetical protein